MPVPRFTGKDTEALSGQPNGAALVTGGTTLSDLREHRRSRLPKLGGFHNPGN